MGKQLECVLCLFFLTIESRRFLELLPVEAHIKMILFDRLLSLIYSYLRPFIKWFLHTFTRLCELQRICYGAPSGACRTRKVETSLVLSRNQNIKNAMEELDEHVELCNDSEFHLCVVRLLGTVLTAKKIKTKLHPDFSPIFLMCGQQIWGYRRLMCIIEKMRTTQYDSDNLDHERRLLDLWKLLVPDVELDARITKQWQHIGFQGDDPKTDFRGMGILGLENLLYFAREYNKEARHVLSHSHHPRHGYTFAIVGINLTSMAYSLFKSGKAKTHFYNVAKGACNIEHFHKFYCYLFYEFDRFWVQSKPSSIMDFSIIHDRFEREITSALQNDRTVFRMNLLVDDI